MKRFLKRRGGAVWGAWGDGTRLRGTGWGGLVPEWVYCRFETASSACMAILVVPVRGRAERSSSEREQIVIRGGAKRSSCMAWWMAQATPERQF